MAFKKGQGGRPKGAKNKSSQALREMILSALDKKGGVAYLEKQASDNPVAFMTLVGKVLPLQVGGEPDNPVLTRVIHEDASQS